MKDKFWRAASGSVRESLFSESMESARSEVDAFLIQEFHPSRRPDDVQSEVAFRRIAAASEVLGDVDGTFLYDVARVGVPIGVGVELPRVPDVFEPKVKWNPSEAEGEFVDTKAENYSSAVESMAQIKEQIEADLKKGFVSRMSRSEAESRYHGRLAVAALGAVPKDLESGEVRVVHDGSFSVDVNHRIRVRDRLRDPLVDDAEAVIRQVKSEDADRPGIRFGMAHDVAHAHRLLPVRDHTGAIRPFPWMTRTLSICIREASSALHQPRIGGRGWLPLWLGAATCWQVSNGPSITCCIPTTVSWWLEARNLATSASSGYSSSICLRCLSAGVNYEAECISNQLVTRFV